jgi:hypothetical protein
MPPRTIDNLGADASNRYASDQQYYDQKIIKESQSVTAQSQIEVTLPSFMSEWEGLFELRRRNLPWADFQAPARYAEQKRRLFTDHILPALSSEEMIDTQIERVKSRAKKDKERNKEKRLAERWEEEIEEKDEEKEKNTLLLLLNCINLLDKALIEANSRRNQYQKG